jgi:hypothetical protein
MGKYLKCPQHFQLEIKWVTFTLQSTTNQNIVYSNLPEIYVKILKVWITYKKNINGYFFIPPPLNIGGIKFYPYTFVRLSHI